MRQILCFFAVICAVPVVASAQSDTTPTQTQKTFTCVRTAAVIGDSFALDCEVADISESSITASHFTIRNVRRYQSSIDVADWIYFDVVAGIDLERVDLTVRLHYADETFLNCSESVRDLKAKEISEELTIPDVCGPDVDWSAVEIIAPAYFDCSGCGVYQFANVPVGRAIPAGAADSGFETERVLDDYRLQSQIRR
jgi:hypothetical protein